MVDEDISPVDRRTMLRRSAGVAVGVWAIPIVESLTSPAAAGSAPPASASRCLTQVFVTDQQSQALSFGPGRERSFDVDLGGSFAEISSITIRLYESPADPVDDEEGGFVTIRKEDGSGSAIGVLFNGSQGDPITVGLSPDGGHPPDQTYADLFADGKAELMVDAGSETTSFTLLRVEVEVCGIVA